MSFCEKFTDGYGDTLEIETEQIDGGPFERVHFEARWKGDTTGDESVDLAFAPGAALQIADAIYRAVDYLGYPSEYRR